MTMTLTRTRPPSDPRLSGEIPHHIPRRPPLPQRHGTLLDEFPGVGLALYVSSRRRLFLYAKGVWVKPWRYTVTLSDLTERGSHTPGQDAAVAAGEAESGTRRRQARAGQDSSWGSRRSRGGCRRACELKRESAWGLENTGRRPRRRAWQDAHHVIGCRLTPETRVQSAMNDVANDIRLARALGADTSARSRGREADGCRGGRGSAVQPGLPVSECGGGECRHDGRGRQVANGRCRVGTIHLHVSSPSPGPGAPIRFPDQINCLRVPTLCGGGHSAYGEGGGARARVRNGNVGFYSHRAKGI